MVGGTERQQPNYFNALSIMRGEYSGIELIGDFSPLPARLNNSCN